MRCSFKPPWTLTQEENKGPYKTNIIPKKQKKLAYWDITSPFTEEKTHPHTHEAEGWGNLPFFEDKSDIFRMLAGNMNGLSLDKYANPKLQEMFPNMQTFHTDLFMFQEINTDFKLQEPQEILEQLIKTHYPTNFTFKSSSQNSAKKSYWLPGDTMIGVLNKQTGAKISAGADKICGRWIWTSLQGRNRRTVTFISAYIVNPGHQKLGNFSVYKQHYNLMLKHAPSHQDPRSQILIDLEQFIQDRIQKKEEIILSIDANETIQTDNIPP